MSNRNVEEFLSGSVFYLKFLGFEFEPKHRWKKFQLFTSFLNLGFIICGQAAFVILSDVDLQEKAVLITFLNYYFVAVGKLVALVYNRKTILGIFQEFRRTYPTEEQEKAYDLLKYRKIYLLIERVLTVFFKTITVFFNVSPLFISFGEFARTGEYNRRTPMLCIFPIKVWEKWSYYVVEYLVQVHSTYVVALTILGLDLCLFSSLLQLCLHFDIIRKNILLIQPNESDEAEGKLKEQIAYHRLMLRISEKVNSVFTPSVLFSLFSSSFILCFTLYQLLGDSSPLVAFKALFLLGYELKQIIVICLLSDHLIEISESVADAVYDHEWYNGTPRYKPLVMVMLLRSQRGAALNLAGISEVSRQTLRRVMSAAYQLFTVLKTGF